MRRVRLRTSSGLERTSLLFIPGGQPFEELECFRCLITWHDVHGKTGVDNDVIAYVGFGGEEDADAGLNSSHVNNTEGTIDASYEGRYSQAHGSLIILLDNSKGTFFFRRLIWWTPFLTLTRHCRMSDRRLTERDASVIAWHLAMNKAFEPMLLKEGEDEFH